MISKITDQDFQHGSLIFLLNLPKRPDFEHSGFPQWKTTNCVSFAGGTREALLPRGPATTGKI
jgi:hypothetical protein